MVTTFPSPPCEASSGNPGAPLPQRPHQFVGNLFQNTGRPIHSPPGTIGARGFGNANALDASCP
eukprot:729875-Prorocentrum_lima.AAC.1